MAEIYKTFSITLDKKKPITNEEFEIVEGDTGNKLEITVLEDGVAVDLSNADIYIIFSHDGITVEQDTVAVGGDVSVGGTDDNIITVLLHSGSYALNGLTECEIKIVSGTTGATWITTPLFNLKSRRSLLNDETIQAVTEFPVLAELIARVEGLEDREQSDWDQTDDTKGNFIKNKPVAGTDFQDATQNLTAETALAAADTIPFYDASATAHRKTTWANLVQKVFGSITGLVKADGAGNISAAVANTDFAAATHASRHASGAADAITPAAIGAQAAMTAGVDYADATAISMITTGGVFTGCEVTAQGTPNQTVAISSGSIITPDGKRLTIDAVASLAASAADSTNPRIDIVYISNAGVVTYLAGTAAASPSQPSTPSNGTLLAKITRAANDNAISTAEIEGQRDFITVSSDFEKVYPVTESSNTFACDLSKKHTKNFSFTIGNTTAKTVTFSNAPYGTCDVILTIKATATATVTWTLDGRAVAWTSGAPTLTSGYTYLILFTYSTLLGKWIGVAQLGAAN